MKKVIGMSLLVVVTLGCSQEEEPKEIITPWDDQIETMKEFEKVEELIIDASKRRDQEMEQQQQ